MKEILYYAYTQEGAFNGIFTEAEEKPSETIKINSELWNELVIKGCKVNMKSIVNYDNEILTLNEKEIYFIDAIKPEIIEEAGINEFMLDVDYRLSKLELGV